MSDRRELGGSREARDLNPDAGYHRVTDDPRELEAAMSAGRRSLERHPYFTLRYAERGERFTRSDSGWLALLARETQARVTANVRWLGSLLSARGMPRLLLERHLAFLAADLTSAVPERAESYARLRRAGEELALERAAHLDDGALEAARTSFDAEVGPEWSRRVPGAGEILAAAVADERCGIAPAVPAVLSWFRDPERFSTSWVAAVDRAIARARERAA